MHKKILFCLWAIEGAWCVSILSSHASVQSHNLMSLFERPAHNFVMHVRLSLRLYAVNVAYILQIVLLKINVTIFMFLFQRMEFRDRGTNVGFNVLRFVLFLLFCQPEV